MSGKLSVTQKKKPLLKIYIMLKIILLKLSILPF